MFPPYEYGPGTQGSRTIWAREPLCACLWNGWVHVCGFWVHVYGTVGYMYDLRLNSAFMATGWVGLLVQGRLRSQGDMPEPQ